MQGRGVNADELAAGFALLAAGSKSEKLAHAWEIIAPQGKTQRGGRRCSCLKVGDKSSLPPQL